MKLFYSPAACSLAPHIILEEGGLTYTTERVDLSSHITEGGAEFKTVNPKAYVPTLILDDGRMLTEVPAILQYLADQVPEKQLTPSWRTWERYRLIEWLNYITTELHKGFTPLFHPKSPDEWKLVARDLLGRRLNYVNRSLGDQPFLMGEVFTVADAYLFTVVRWAAYVRLDLSPWPVLVAHRDRVGERPAVQRALAAEGLL